MKERIQINCPTFYGIECELKVQPSLCNCYGVSCTDCENWKDISEENKEKCGIYVDYTEQE